MAGIFACWLYLARCPIFSQGLASMACLCRFLELRASIGVSTEGGLVMSDCKLDSYGLSAKNDELGMELLVHPPLCKNAIFLRRGGVLGDGEVGKRLLEKGPKVFVSYRD